VDYYLPARVLRAGGYVERESVGKGKGWRRSNGERTDWMETVEPAARARCLWRFDARPDPRGLPVITQITRLTDVAFSSQQWEQDHPLLLPDEEPAGPPASYNEPEARRLDRQLLSYHAAGSSDKNVPAAGQLVPAGAAGLPALPAAAAAPHVIAPAAAAGAAPARQRERDGGSGSLAQELRGLLQLKSEGILTADEFADAKRAALRRYCAADH
jgi:hypothetical protein